MQVITVTHFFNKCKFEIQIPITKLQINVEDIWAEQKHLTEKGAPKPVPERIWCKQTFIGKERNQIGEGC